MTEKKFTGELDRFSYALGLNIASNLIRSGVKSFNPDIFIEAINDTYSGEMPKIMPEEANKILENFMEKSNSDQVETNLHEGMEFLSINADKEGIIELDNGLQYKILNQGEGPKPGPDDKVKCHYHGTLIDGTVFDSSIERGQPSIFPVNGVIMGWVHALQMMEVGSKWRLFIPPDLAYGEQGAGDDIGPNSTLIFDVELLEIV